MNVQDVELLPGFIVHDFTPGYTILTIPSGFKLRIGRLGPYVFDDLYERDDLKDPGPFMIKVILLEKIQPPGIEQWLEYKPPLDDNGMPYCPDQEQFPKEWMYYHQWIQHRKKRNDIATKRESERIDRSLLVGVKVLDGPISIDDDDEWLTNLLANYHEPASRGEKYLAFLKMVVIQPLVAGEVIRDLMMTEEVNVEGLKLSFDRFRRALERDSSV